ncbi:hypothetical protein HpMS107_25070 [Helicobacter pylori]
MPICVTAWKQKGPTANRFDPGLQPSLVTVYVLKDGLKAARDGQHSGSASGAPRQRSQSANLRATMMAS